MASQRLTDSLREERVDYEVLPHRQDVTASETAQDTHTPGRAFAKSVVLEADGHQALAVLPSTKQLDLQRAKTVLEAELVTLADESKMKELFPDCEVGAEPPFGNLYGLPVYVDSALAENETITFNGGRHDEAIRLRYADFERLVNPVTADLGE